MIWVFETFWSLDAPQNCWPSLHVGLSYLAAFAALDEASEPEFVGRRRVAGFTLFWATAITLSTMSVRQHYFWDALGGLTLAVLAYGAAGWRLKRRVS
jgi:membrane-associated phospholipid phosphatase